jgi:hypothetical protein
MGLGDFLRKHAKTPLLEHFLMAGVNGVIATNSESILAAARACFGRHQCAPCDPRLHLRLWVDSRGCTQPPWPKPFFRGLDHLVFAGFDSQNSILIDLRSCRAIGRFSPAMGGHQVTWKTLVFPVLISIMSATVGITELHCGCVARGGKGLLLVGRSGAGKSTLSLALAQGGFTYLTDDRTFLSRWEGRLAAWGLPTQLKLRLDALDWFPELKDLRQTTVKSGERAMWLDPSPALGIQRIQRCEPVGLVFLERQECAPCGLSAVAADHAGRQLEADLMAEAPEAAAGQRAMIADLVKLPCWRLTYGGSPQDVARFLYSRLLQ